MTSTATEAKTARFDWGGFIKKYAIVGILILFIIIMTILSEGSFIQPSNLINVVNQIAPIGIIATGMTFVIIINGIDLSVGSIVAMSAVVSASLAQLPTAPKLLFPGLQGLPIIVALLAGLGIGALLGAINGGLVAGFGIPPFIATLGMMTAARGAANIYADNGRPVSYLTPEFNFLGSGDFLFIPMPIFLLLLVGVVAHFALNYTRFGRHTYALGGNEQAARVSGINIKMLTLGIFTLSGFLAGLAGMVLAARVQSAVPTLGTQMELDAIAAAVIGGTSFNGGIGTIWGTMVGALIIGIINNGLNLMNVSPFMQMIVKGAIIVIAIIIDERKNR